MFVMLVIVDCMAIVSTYAISVMYYIGGFGEFGEFCLSGPISLWLDSFVFMYVYTVFIFSYCIIMCCLM